MIGRHITGVGLGATSLTGYVAGAEYPLVPEPAIKTTWSFFSILGAVLRSFYAKLLFNLLPGYIGAAISGYYHLFHMVPFLILLRG